MSTATITTATTTTAPMTFTATPYRISTITVTGSIGTNVTLDNLYQNISKNIDNDITYLEFGKNKHDLQSTGINEKLSKKKKVVKPKSRFDNQLTIVFQMNENKYNTKLFKNGNVQMTGVKSIEKGYNAIDHLITILHKYDDGNIFEKTENLCNNNYSIRLINSDFKINYEIRLDHLYNLITKKYNIICSYEPCIYPGAKIEYYYPNNGYCKCESFCNGKSAVCKKITIAVFQSGCVIITGANKQEHIDVAYGFICGILKDNIDDVYRKKFVIPSSVQN
jgi:TATA-box binding protein (TBP) (component of TFIID and TFIIIB)